MFGKNINITHTHTHTCACMHKSMQSCKRVPEEVIRSPETVCASGGCEMPKVIAGKEIPVWKRANAL